MTPPHRILHVISQLEGGAGRGTVELVRGLQRDQRFEVRICVLGQPEPSVDLSGVNGTVFLNAPVHHRSKWFSRHWQLRQLLRTWQPSLVHSHLWPTVLTTGAVLGRNVPHVVHIRDTPAALHGSRWGDKVRRFLIQRIANRVNTQLVAVSNSAADYTADALGLARSRIQTIMNGVDLEPFLKVARLERKAGQPFVVACAGRLVADKGFDLIIRAISILTTLRERVLVRIAGTGSAQPKLRLLAKELGVESNIEFTGHVNDMPQFLAEADIFVHSSIAAEGLARVLIESQAASRPVVTMDHTGAREAIIDGVTGLVTLPNDTLALSAAIRTLLEQTDKHLTMGVAAREWAARRFSSKRVIEEVASLYQELLSPECSEKSPTSTNQQVFVS